MSKNNWYPLQKHRECKRVATFRTPSLPFRLYTVRSPRLCLYNYWAPHPYILYAWFDSRGISLGIQIGTPPLVSNHSTLRCWVGVVVLGRGKVKEEGKSDVHTRHFCRSAKMVGYKSSLLSKSREKNFTIWFFVCFANLTITFERPVPFWWNLEKEKKIRRRIRRKKN
jgi:hypothetical protein